VEERPFCRVSHRRVPVPRKRRAARRTVPPSTLVSRQHAVRQLCSSPQPMGGVRLINAIRFSFLCNCVSQLYCACRVLRGSLQVRLCLSNSQTGFSAWLGACQSKLSYRINDRPGIIPPRGGSKVCPDSLYGANISTLCVEGKNVLSLTQRDCCCVRCSIPLSILSSYSNTSEQTHIYTGLRVFTLHVADTHGTRAHNDAAE